MSRRPRIICKYQHIIVRGIGKQILFESEEDYQKYLDLIKRFMKDTSLEIMAYCLMENHVHLLIHDEEGEISGFMKRLGISYAAYYNNKYARTGHLFQDRYKSEPITDEKYLLTVFRYILNNPVKAGIADADKYEWSSYQEFVSRKGLTEPGILGKMVGSPSKFKKFMGEEEGQECMEYSEIKHNDEWAKKVIKDTLNIKSGTEIQSMTKNDRNEALAQLKEKGISIRQLERLTGINRGVIQKAKSCQ